MAPNQQKTNEKLQRLLEVLQKLEAEDKEITIKELADIARYRLSTMETYVSKKLKHFFLKPSSRGKYKVSGTQDLDIFKFSAHMIQKVAFIDESAIGLAPRLLRRSRDAFFTALESYNRPTQNNRTESFCIMMVNAYELFLKAEFIKIYGEQALYYKEEENKSLSLRDILKKIIPDNQNDVRINIEYLADLRDRAIHLLIPELQSRLSRLFQASVLNYVDRYRKTTGVDTAESMGLGLISLVVDREDIGSGIIKEKYSEITALKIQEFLEKFSDTEKRLNSDRFAISIDYKLVLTKKEKEGDITLNPSSDGALGIMIEVPKDIDKTHPYRQKDVIIQIRSRIPEHIVSQFNEFTFQAIIFKEKIKNSKSNQFYLFIDNPETHRYSSAFIDLIVRKITEDPDYISRCRESLRYHRKINKDK